MQILSQIPNISNTSAEEITKKFGSIRELYQQYLEILGAEMSLSEARELDLKSINPEKKNQCSMLLAKLNLQGKKNGFIKRKLGNKNSSKIFKVLFDKKPSSII